MFDQPIERRRKPHCRLGRTAAIASRLVLTGLVAASAVASYADACPTGEFDSTRIVAAGGSITEILYALGVQDRIVAVDTTSNFPAEALELPKVGYVRALSTEGVLSLAPTLILGEHDTGPPAVVEQLGVTGIPTVIVPEAFDGPGIVEKVRCVGTLLGVQTVAEAYIERELTPMLETLRTPGEDAPKVAVLLGLREGTPVGAGAQTSGDGLIAMAGGVNVLGDFEGWKPLSLEALAAANPDVIVMPNRGVDMAGGAEAVLAHPAIRLTPAAKHQRLVAMDGMTILGFGPRTLGAAVELGERIADSPTP